MAELFGDDAFDARLEELEDSLGGAKNLAAAFSQELRAVQTTVADTNREIAGLRSGIGSGLKRAVDGLVLDGKRLSEVLGEVAKAMVNATYSAAVRPVTNHAAGLLAGGLEAIIGGMMPFKNGAGFSQGRVRPFASGGIVSGATMFAMRGGAGLMGEAGPEAIVPLARGSDGRLGVRMQGNQRPVQIVMNISTPDVAGFQRSQSQIAAQLDRAIRRGQRNQ